MTAADGISVGVCLGEYGPAATADRIIELARAAEAHGLDSVWVSDRIVVPAHVTTEYPYNRSKPYDPVDAERSYEPLVTLGVVAGVTQRVRLGVSVLAAAAREPLLLAKQLSTLDDLSGGRLTVGIGIGWLREEFDLVAPGAFVRRAALTDDYLVLFSELWTSEGPVAFRGTAYSTDPVRFAPRPLQRPRPPLEVGGNSAAARRRTVRYADAWHAMQISPTELQPAVEQLRSFATEEGRSDQHFGVTVRCSLSARRLSGAKEWQLGGTAHDISEQLARYRNAGATSLIFDLDSNASLEQHEELLARLAEARART